MASSSSATSTMILLLFTLCFSLHRHGVLVQAGRLSSPLTTQMISPTIMEGDYIKHYAVYNMMPGDFHGAKATFSVSKFPSLSPNQESGASIFLGNNGYNGDPRDIEDVNSIEVGWHVSPELYGDTQTRFYVHWQAYEIHQKIPSHIPFGGGCYNLRCPAFVVVDDSPIVPGQVLNVAPGKQQTISLTIYQDLSTRDWLLVYSDEAVQGVSVGRFPKSLFTSLVHKANIVRFGGYVLYEETIIGPPMGNGNFPAAGDGEDQQAAYMAGLNYMDDSGSFLNFLPGDLRADADANSCYNSTLVVSDQSTSLDLYYGGPGGCTIN